MQRREALRLLASAATLPLVSRDAFSLFQEVHQQLPQTAALKALDAHQNATVVTISELIIPQTDTPGAKAARVNEFIDLIRAGIARRNHSCSPRWMRPFVSRGLEINHVNENI